MIEFIKPHWARCGLIILLMVVTNALALLYPWAVLKIIDEVIPKANSGLLNHLIGIVCVGLLIQAVCHYYRRLLNAQLGMDVLKALRLRVYDALATMPLASAYTLSPSHLFDVFSREVDAVHQFIFSDLIEAFYACINLCLIGAFLMYLNLKLALIVFATVPFFILINLVLIPKGLSTYKNYREKVAEYLGRFNQQIQALKTVRILNAQIKEREHLVQNLSVADHLYTRAAVYESLIIVLLEVMTVLGVLGVFIFGAGEVIHKHMTTGELMAFYIYLGMLFLPIVRMGGVVSGWMKARASWHNIIHLLEGSADKNSREVIKEKGPIREITMHQVSFQYAKGVRVLDNISLKVSSGERVAIIGSNGAGKSSLVHLLMKLYEVNDGKIFLNDINIQEWRAEDIRHQICLASQDDVLFEGTILENIVFGLNEYRLEAVVDAATMACIHDVIIQLPLGYQSRVNEKGLNFSSGQRQRIVLARALCRNPSVLILDEATSSIDSATEQLIYENIRTWSKERIIIVIAHRFSSLMNAQRIVVLRDGVIEHSADHNYLLKNNQFYSNLYQQHLACLHI